MTLSEPHLASVKHILWYLVAHLTMVFSCMVLRYNLVAYSDIDWAGYLDTQCSTSGYDIFLRDNLISWSSKR
jgi:hypothetical protein